jgi:hypothetical protein
VREARRQIVIELNYVQCPIGIQDGISRQRDAASAHWSIGPARAWKATRQPRLSTRILCIETMGRPREVRCRVHANVPATLADGRDNGCAA